ncbi:hypothetical protein GW17_00020963 [Ensete ventricosum]|nr:hypothetical protein GW17_00020963 [Ensete ventricosum]
MRMSTQPREVSQGLKALYQLNHGILEDLLLRDLAGAPRYKPRFSLPSGKAPYRSVHTGPAADRYAARPLPVVVACGSPARRRTPRATIVPALGERPRRQRKKKGRRGRDVGGKRKKEGRRGSDGGGRTEEEEKMPYLRRGGAVRSWQAEVVIDCSFGGDVHESWRGGGGDNGHKRCVGRGDACEHCLCSACFFFPLFSCLSTLIIHVAICAANLPAENFSPILSEHTSGVYFGWAGLSTRGIYKMVMSIGWNPYFDNTEKTIVSVLLSVEPWLLHDFGEDFYGEELRLAIVGYIRPEVLESKERTKKNRRIYINCLFDSILFELTGEFSVSRESDSKDS